MRAALFTSGLLAFSCLALCASGDELQQLAHCVDQKDRACV